LKKEVGKMRSLRVLAILLMVVSILAIGVGVLGCGGGDGDGGGNGEPPPADENGAPPAEENGDENGDGNGAPPADVELVITSPAFGEGETIPTEHACVGQDMSPELNWSGVPAGTQSFALIVDDPDATGGTFNHWVIFNIPADEVGLEEGIPTREQLDNGALQGNDDFGMLGYRGPCPPPGSEHHYYFILYALDTTLGLEAGVTKAEVLEAMEGHVLAQAELVGVYQR
jgi:Raf kinase inhibitor-like YbhB/YbcL family protein